MNALLHGVFDAAALLDPDLKIIDVNNAFGVLAGLKPRELKRRIELGVRPFELIELESGADRESAETCLRENRPVHLVEQKAKSSTGDSLTVHLSFLPLPGGGERIEAVLLTIRDVTSEALAQQRMKELLAMTRARADDLERHVEQRTRELRVALDEVTRLSRTDPLTQVLNRRAFSEQAQQALDLAERHKRNVAVLLCDLDHFKRVNDEYGHAAGDIILQAGARALESCIRQSDRVARVGGEEFAVLLSETHPSGAFAVAQRINEAFRQLPIGELVKNARRVQTVSVGVALFPDHGRSLDDILTHADQAMYAAKASGRDTSVLFESQMQLSTRDLEPERPRVLVAGEAEMIARWQKLLEDRYRVTCAPTATSAMLYAQGSVFDVIISDMELPDKSGIDLLGDTLSHQPGAVRILIVGHANVFVASRAVHAARVDCFLLRAEAEEKLLDAIEDSLERRELIMQSASTLKSAKKQTSIGAELVKRVLKERALDYAFQPIVRSKDRSVFALEALCRPPAWLHLGPSDLFDTALRTGLIWQLGQAGRDRIAQLIPLLDKGALLFLNLHPAEIEDPALLSREHPLAAYSERIVFEITERASIPDFDHLKRKLTALRHRGYRFAVDDLGAGYASLCALALLEPDFIKLDRTLIHGASSSRRRVSLLSRIIDFAAEHQIQVIAEGIEEEVDAKCVVEVGCPLLQGYLFGRPERATR